LLLTSNLSALRALALVEDCCCFRYAANAIEAPLASSHRAVRRFQETGQYTRRPESDRKRATTHRDDKFLNNNGVPLFLPVSVFFRYAFFVEIPYGYNPENTYFYHIIKYMTIF
jgi:hypothetical protein